MGFYNGWAVTCRYVIPDLAATNLSLEEVLDQAIALTLLEYPLLQVGIKNGGSRTPSWVRLDQIDLRQQVKWLVVSSGAGF